MPSRVETNAMREPSAEKAGSLSAPESPVTRRSSVRLERSSEKK